MKKYNLVIELEGNLKYYGRFNGNLLDMFPFEGEYKPEYSLSEIDRFTAGKASLEKYFYKPEEVVDIAIYDSETKKKIRPLFNDLELQSILNEYDEEKSYLQSREYMSLVGKISLELQKGTFNLKQIANQPENKDIAKSIMELEDLLLSIKTARRELKESAEKDNEDQYGCAMRVNGLQEQLLAYISDYRFLRMLYQEMKKRDLEDLKLLCSDLTNEAGARYSLVALDSLNNKNYYVPSLDLFMPEEALRKDFIPKDRLVNLDRITANLPNFDSIGGSPTDARGYISYQYGGEEIKIPVIFNNSYWAYFSKNFSGRLNVDDGVLRSAYDQVYKLVYDRTNPDFLTMLTSSEYKKGSHINERLQQKLIDISDNLKAVESKVLSHEDYIEKKTLYSQKNMLASDLLTILITEYNSFRSMYLNYAHYMKNGLVRKEDEDKQKI